MIDLKHEIERELNMIDPPDLWDRIQADSSSNGDAAVVDLTTARHRRRPSLWLAVAAVGALLVLVGALAVRDDDQTVDTTPVTKGPVVLPKERPVPWMELAGTDWQIFEAIPEFGDGAQYRSTECPKAGQGRCQTYDIELSFRDATVTWGDGCATASADYVIGGDERVLILTNEASTNPGCTPATPNIKPVIDAVMGSERIPVSFDLGRLILGDPEGEHLTLIPGVTSDVNSSFVP